MAYLTVQNGVTYCVEEDGTKWVYTPAATTLDEAKAARIAYLYQGEASALASFQSSALGSLHTYVMADNTGKDYSSLFNGEFAFINSTLYDGTSSIEWYTVENGNVAHTKAQFNQVFVDGRNHVASTKYKRATKEAQVNAVTKMGDEKTVGWPVNLNPPAVPTGLTGTAGAAGSGQVTLNWTANSDVTLIGGGGYNVYVDGATNKANTSLVTGTTYTVTGLTTGAHTFAITAVDTDGNESAKCSTVSVTVS